MSALQPCSGERCSQEPESLWRKLVSAPVHPLGISSNVSTELLTHGRALRKQLGKIFLFNEVFKDKEAFVLNVFSIHTRVAMVSGKTSSSLKKVLLVL